jgi:hypothetical protein
MLLKQEYVEFVNDTFKEDLTSEEINTFFSKCNESDFSYIERCLGQGAKYLLERDSENNIGDIKTKKMESRLLNYIKKRI